MVVWGGSVVWMEWRVVCGAWCAACGGWCGVRGCVGATRVVPGLRNQVEDDMPDETEKTKTDAAPVSQDDPRCGICWRLSIHREALGNVASINSPLTLDP